MFLRVCVCCIQVASAYEEAQKKQEGTEGSALLASLKLLKMIAEPQGTRGGDGSNRSDLAVLAAVKELRDEMCASVADLRRELSNELRSMESRLLGLPLQKCSHSTQPQTSKFLACDIPQPRLSTFDLLPLQGYADNALPDDSLNGSCAPKQDPVIDFAQEESGCHEGLLAMESSIDMDKGLSRPLKASYHSKALVSLGWILISQLQSNRANKTNTNGYLSCQNVLWINWGYICCSCIKP